MHAGRVARNVDLGGPLFGARRRRCVIAARRGRHLRRRVRLTAAPFRDVVFIVVVVIVYGYFENSFGRWKNKTKTFNIGTYSGDALHA